MWVSSAVFELYVAVLQMLMKSKEWQWYIVRIFSLNVLLFKMNVTEDKFVERKSMTSRLFNIFCSLDVLSPIIGRDEAISLIYEVV